MNLTEVNLKELLSDVLDACGCPTEQREAAEDAFFATLRSNGRPEIAINNALDVAVGLNEHAWRTGKARFESYCDEDDPQVQRGYWHDRQYSKAQIGRK